jgi:hypothetical protein
MNTKRQNVVKIKRDGQVVVRSLLKYVMLRVNARLKKSTFTLSHCFRFVMTCFQTLLLFLDICMRQYDKLGAVFFVEILAFHVY